METYLGRKITREITFDSRTDDFGNCYDAYRYLEKHGYSHGSMCGCMPIAFTKGEYTLTQKWRNFYPREKELVDGVLIGEFRSGEVKAYFFNQDAINIKEDE